MDKNLYEQDFYAWTIENANLIRQRKFSEIDLEHVVEELKDMGISTKRELINRIGVLLAHLLKWEYQPSMRSSSWQGTIKEQRRRVLKLLKDNPSLKSQIDNFIPDAFESAIISASVETGIPEFDFPQICPFSKEQIFDTNYWPIE
ncbi:MAG: DUF29 domain-containing protein [Desulfobacterales bacterium]|nr:DUF29 domain-containing protein [Desulfobacterales bacterium]